MNEFEHAISRLASGSIIPFDDDCDQVCSIAIKALKKQIPQKVVETPDKHNYGYCPVCGRIYWDKCHVGNYCDKCGQSLEAEV